MGVSSLEELLPLMPTPTRHDRCTSRPRESVRETELSLAPAVLLYSLQSCESVVRRVSLRSVSRDSSVLICSAVCASCCCCAASTRKMNESACRQLDTSPALTPEDCNRAEANNQQRVRQGQSLELMQPFPRQLSQEHPHN